MVHPLVAVGMLIAIVLILALPRKKAIAPFLLAFFTIPIGQVLVLGGVHLTMHQILILTVLGRMAAFRGSSSEKRFAGGFNAFDKLVVLWTLVALIVFALQFLDMQALIKGLGDLVVSLGGYLAVRFLIPDREAVRRTVKVLAVVCVIQGVFMVSEQFTYQNVFSSFGANPPTMREGHIRSEGAMGNLWCRRVRRCFDSFLSLAVDGKKIPDGSVRGTCRGYGHGVRVPREHVMDGLWREPCGAWLLASAQADATCPVGTGGHPGGITPCRCMGRFGPSLRKLT